MAARGAPTRWWTRGDSTLAVARANIDTRNDEINPSTGWLILAEYEHGSGRVTDAGTASTARACRRRRPS